MLVPRIHRDRRGFFSEAYNRAGSGAGRKTGIRPGQSFVVPGARRGAELHFQIPPFAQDKHVRYRGLEITDVDNF